MFISYQWIVPGYCFTRKSKPCSWCVFDDVCQFFKFDSWHLWMNEFGLYMYIGKIPIVSLISIYLIICLYLCLCAVLILTMNPTHINSKRPDVLELQPSVKFYGFTYRTSNNKYVPLIYQKKPKNKRSRFTIQEQKTYLELSKVYGHYVAQDDQNTDQQFKAFKVTLNCVWKFMIKLTIGGLLTLMRFPNHSTNIDCV